jgi:hypothetical protein
MSREDIVAIAVRLFAIFLGIYVLRTLFGVVQFTSEMTFDAKAIVASLAVVGAMAGGVLLLWFFPLSVARKLLPVMKEPRSESKVGVDTLFSLGLILMGLWLLANAIIDGLYWASLLLAMRAADMMSLELTSEQQAAIFTTAVEAIVAVFLILGSTGIRNVVYRFRNVHVDTPPSPDR